MKYIVSSSSMYLLDHHQIQLHILRPDEAQTLLCLWANQGVKSCIWHPDPAIAQAIAETFGVACVDRCPQFALEPGDEVLEIVFIAPSFISSLQELRELLKERNFVLANCEYRLLQIRGR